MRASRLPPPWTGLFASPSRPRQALLIREQPPMPVPGAGKSPEPQGAAGRESRGGQGEPGGSWGWGFVTPHIPKKDTCQECSGPRPPSISPTGGFGPALGTPQGAVSPGGAGMHFQAAHSPAGSGEEASWEPWPGTGPLESARDLLPCQRLPGKGDSD